MGVAEVESSQKLEHQTFDHVAVDFPIQGVEVLLQVLKDKSYLIIYNPEIEKKKFYLITVLEDKSEFPL